MRWCSGRWSSWWILVVVRRQGRTDAVGCDRRTAETRKVSRPAWASRPAVGLDPLGPLGPQWASVRWGRSSPQGRLGPERSVSACMGVRPAVVTKCSSPVKVEAVTSARPVMLTLGEGRYGCALCGHGSHEASTDLVGRIRQLEQHNRCLHPFHAEIRQYPRLRTVWMAYSPDLWVVSAVTSSLHEGARKAGHARGDRTESDGFGPWARGRMTSARYSPRRLRGLRVSAVCNDGQTKKSHSGRTRNLFEYIFLLLWQFEL